MIEPRNGHDLLVLFTKFHKQLGFEKIHGTYYLRVLVARAGESVVIQLVHKLSQFRNYYVKSECPGCWSGWEWRRRGDTWQPWHPKEGWGYPIYPDPENLLTLNHDASQLLHKSLSDKYDIVACWIQDCELDDDLEVLELQPLFKTEKGRIRKLVKKPKKYWNGENLRTPDRILLALMQNGSLGEPDVFRVVDAKPAYIKNGVNRLLRRQMIYVVSEARHYPIYDCTRRGRQYVFDRWFEHVE